MFCKIKPDAIAYGSINSSFRKEIQKQVTTRNYEELKKESLGAEGFYKGGEETNDELYQNK